METSSNFITIEATVNAPIEKVWECWTNPQHMMQWNQASPEWHCPKAENDLKEGGKLSATMAAKDGSFSFDFWGTHTLIKTKEQITTILGDDRKMNVVFIADGDTTKVIESFEPENENSRELQEQGWQAILNSFKVHTENCN
jgi:uncharacterized protein YndB with AHSA1/START domain